MISEELTNRIMSTMSDDLTKILATVSEELNELAKECCKAIRQCSYNDDRILEELADVVIMITALKKTYGITDSMLEHHIIRVCERYEGGH